MSRIYSVYAQDVYVDKEVINGEVYKSIIKNVPIRKLGNGRFYVCCPFHHENTPSLLMDVKQDIWHCFGCGASNKYKPNTLKQTNLNDLRKIIDIRYRQDQFAKAFNEEFAREIEYTRSYDSTILEYMESCGKSNDFMPF